MLSIFCIRFTEVFSLSSGFSTWELVALVGWDSNEFGLVICGVVR